MMADLENQVEFNSIRIQEEMIEAILPISELLYHDWEFHINETGDLSYEWYLQTIPVYYMISDIYTAINWVNSSGIIEWVYPYERNHEAVNRSLWTTANGEPNVGFITAYETNSIQLTNIIQLFQGGIGIATYIPFIANSTIVGYFNVVIELTKLFDHIYSESSHKFQTSLAIYEDEVIIYEVGESFDRGMNYVVSDTITVYNVNWEIHGRASKSQRYGASFLSTIFIPIIGITAASLVFYANFLSEKQQKTQKRMNEDRHQYELKLIHYEKLNSLGTLAGGMAHEFNNALQSIQVNISLMKYLIDNSDNDISDAISKIETVINRSKDLTNQILVFSRQNDFELKRVDAVDVLMDTLNIFESTKDRRIQTMRNFLHSNSVISANESQLSQCYLNLLNNAHDAIAEAGFIEINTRNLSRSELDLASMIKAPEILYDYYFTVEIIDSGQGISERDQVKVFDPFFTTKDIGKGTGLGLSMIYRYMTVTNGMISLKSTENIGTRITLHFPLSAEKETIENESESGFQSRHHEVIDKFTAKYHRPPRILLVDDETDITNNLEKILTHEKFDVHVENDALAALQVSDNTNGGSHFDLVILDVNMPDMSGTQVAEIMVKRTPELKIIFITGFNESDVRVDQIEAYDMLQKPFSIESLFELITKKLSKYL